MVFSVRLDPTTESYLDDLVSHTKSPNRSALIKHLIKKYWSETNASETIIEQMGGVPKHLLKSAERLSDKTVKRRKIAEYLSLRTSKNKKK
jgi:metal-responsive CopG/Arc/MetJ family transcriptional regulator